MVGIRGESNFGKLIRCSAVQSAPNPMYTSQPNIFGNQIINGQTVQQIATLLCKPFGISVSSTSSNASTVIPQLVYNIGDTPYQIIEKIARYAQLLVYDDLNGNVVLADVGTNSQSSGCNLPGNVSSADFTFDQNDEYSDYYVYWQNFNSTSDISSGSGFLAHGYASDTNVKMFKPLALISAQVVNGVDLGQQTANWEMKRRLGRSQILNVRLSPTSANPNPWFDSSGTLWTPNVLVPLSLPIEKVNNVSWIIARVTYGLNPQDGTYCDLQLMDPAAFSIEPTSLFPTQADIINNLQNPPYVNTSVVNSSIPSQVNIPGGGT
jgi:prophage tail gpP-like protein